MTTRTVASVLAANPSLMFVADSQDTDAIKASLGKEASDYDSFFVDAAMGDYTEVWGMCGIVPRSSKLITRLV